MHMFRHYDISNHQKIMFLPDLFKHIEKATPAPRSVQQRLAAVTTESDKVKMVGAVVSLEPFSHERKFTPKSEGFPQTQTFCAMMSRPLIACAMKWGTLIVWGARTLIEWATRHHCGKIFGALQIKEIG